MHDFVAGFILVPFAAFAIYTTLTLAMKPESLGLGQAVLFAGLIAAVLLHHKMDFSCYVGEMTSKRIIAIFAGIMTFAIMAGMYQHDGGSTQRDMFMHMQGSGQGAYTKSMNSVQQPTFRATESYTWEPMNR